jgi:LysM repeat protein
MRKTAFWLGIFILTVSFARAQDSGTQQQLDKLSGQIQDILAAQELQGKRLDALEKQISDLSDKVNTPAVNTAASADDLKALAAQVQEIDRKRQADRDLILKQIEQISKVTGGGAPASRHPAVNTPASGGNETAGSSAPATPQKGYDYKVQAGDTISAIAKAYREQGVKVSAGQILKANPKLDPSKIYVGQKIFIPDPNAK